MDRYFMYVRKSTEPLDRQKLSLSAQIRENRRKFPEITDIEVLEESHSAFTPEQRPVFNEMVRRLQSGEAKGIVCWHPDRLSRNEIDGARVVYLVRQGIDLKFTSYPFDPSPEGIMMLQMALSQSQYSSTKLSFEVKRGNREKYEQGGITWVPGPGYRNNKADHTIEADPERFDLVKRMWDLFLYSGLTPAHIRNLANEEWGFRTIPLGSLKGNRELAYSTLYKIFRNPLYAGFYLDPSGRRYNCTHPPMVTEEEFWRAQSLLATKGRPRPRAEFSPYTTNLIRCGECGCAITVDRKKKTLKSGKILNYEYYRCTKKKGACSQPYIEVKELEQQISAFLEQISLPDAFYSWVTENMNLLEPVVEAQEASIRNSETRTVESILAELNNLILMRRKDFITDQQFLEQKSGLLEEKGNLEGSTSANPGKWLEPLSELRDFGNRSKFWFTNGPPEMKKSILLATTGSNLTLRDKKLHTQPIGPFAIIAKEAECAVWLGIAQDLRTCLEKSSSWKLPLLAAIPTGRKGA